MSTTKYIASIVWNMFIWAGTAVLVSFYDWSPWWFVLTFCMTIIIKSSDKNDL